MFRQFTARKSALVAACAAVLVGGVAAASHTTARETPAAEQVGLSHRAMEAASAYETYMGRASAIRASSFKDGASVRAALKTSASYEPKQLEAGAIAYAALVALQDKAFVRSVERLSDRDAEMLIGNPAAVMQMTDSDGAVRRVSAVLRTQGEELTEVGKSVKQSAYDVQHQAWSKQKVVEPSKRLAQVKELSATRFVARPEDTARLVKAVEEAPRGFGRGGAGSPVVQRGLTLAALTVMGRAGDRDEGTVAQLLSEKRSDDCLRMAKLNLYQCLAVAGPHYEDVFCAGQHALIDTGKCVSGAAGGSDDAMTHAAYRHESDHGYGAAPMSRRPDRR